MIPAQMALQRDLLISVTSFFRDPEAFASLKKGVFPRILAKAGREGCDSHLGGGLCHRRRGILDCHIAAGILDRNGRRMSGADFCFRCSGAAIEKARTGRYPDNIAADLTDERLSRHFTKIEGGYQINKNLREMCVFTRHNLIDDFPRFRQAGFDHLPQRPDLPGDREEEHLPAISLCAQAAWVSHVGRIGGGGSATCFRWPTGSTGSMPGGKWRGSPTCFTGRPRC